MKRPRGRPCFFKDGTVTIAFRLDINSANRLKKIVGRGHGDDKDRNLSIIIRHIIHSFLQDPQKPLKF